MRKRAEGERVSILAAFYAGVLGGVCLLLAACMRQARS